MSYQRSPLVSLPASPKGAAVSVGSCGSGWCGIATAELQGYTEKAYLTDSIPPTARTRLIPWSSGVVRQNYTLFLSSLTKHSVVYPREDRSADSPLQKPV